MLEPAGQPAGARAARQPLLSSSPSQAHGIPLTLVRAYNDEPGLPRDPRGWTITLAYAGVDRGGGAAAAAVAGDDAAAVAFHPIQSLPPLAFDHKRIVRDAFAHLSAAERALPGGGDAALAAGLDAAAARLAGPWEPTRE